MKLHEKQAFELLDNLITKTDSGSLEWTQSSLDNTFEVNLPRATVRIAKREDFDEDIGEAYEFRIIEIINEHGTTVHEIYPWQLAKEFAAKERRFGTIEKMFDHVYAGARDRALNVGGVFQYLLHELGSDDGESMF